MSDVDPTALFEPLYVAAAEGRETLRWDRGGPHPLRMVAPGGALIVVAKARNGDGPVDGPPWPLARAEIEALGGGGLDVVQVEDVRRPEIPAHWRAEFRR
jgi:hypothetical protein